MGCRAAAGSVVEINPGGVEAVMILGGCHGHLVAGVILENPKRFVRRIGGDRKFHLVELEGVTHLFCADQMPVMYRAEGSSEDAYA